MEPVRLKIMVDDWRSALWCPGQRQGWHDRPALDAPTAEDLVGVCLRSWSRVWLLPGRILNLRLASALSAFYVPLENF